jgi:anti-sigma factor ChrR (cupin superfamily)
MEGWMAAQVRHPEPETLQDFALGRLEAREMDSIAAHLSSCPACLRRVRETPDDGLVRLLRHPPAPGAGITCTS